MASPQVPIEVDPQTGIWTTDKLPMLYMPRHFFVNYYAAMDRALGREAHARLLYDASHLSAYQWCAAEAKTHGLRDVAVFRHYLKRMSQRGWAQFLIDSLELAAGRAAVRVENSAFALQLGKTGRRECAMFAGSLAGGLEWAASDAGQPGGFTATESQCLSEGHSHCIFSVSRSA